MRKLLLFIFSALLVAYAIPTNLIAQQEVGQIVGTVLDPSGAAVPEAKVTVKNVATGVERPPMTTDNRGSFVVVSLLPGLYEVKVEHSGFAPAIQRVQLTVGGKPSVEIKLEISGTTQEVQVTAEGGVEVNTETQTLSQVITTQQVLEFPTISRNPYALVVLSGNVSEGDPTGRGVGVAINGQRAASTNVLLDGSPNNDEFIAAVGMNVPLDSVQEFSVITNNFTAEYGRASGGVVNVATKSGTNDYHGTGYWFGRYSALASNSFVDNANGIKKPVFTRNQLGYSIGGPIKKNRAFFFQSTEWTRVRSGATRVVVVPTSQLIGLADSNTRNFFSSLGTLKSSNTFLRTITRQDLIDAGSDPCGAGSLCATLVSPSTPVFNRVSYTVPSDSGGGDPQNAYNLVGRVDWNISDTTTFYARYALENALLQAGTISNSPYSRFDTGQNVKNNNMLVSLVHTFSPQLVTQSKVVFSRLNLLQPQGAAVPTLFFRNVTTRFLGDRVALPGYLPFSPGSGIPFGGPQNFGQLFQDVNFVKGSHQWRFGGSYVYIQDNRTFGAYADPSATLSTGTIKTAMNNFLLGQLQSFQSAIDPQGKFPCGSTATPGCTVTLPVGQPNFSRSNRYNEFAVYAQDSWRIRPRFTINLGIRWEYFGVQHNKNANLDSNYYDGSGGSIFQRIRNGDVATVPNSPIGGLWKKDWNNFAPRLGFAWDVRGDGKTSIRGGYGIGYERNFGNVTFNVIQNPPGYAVISIISGVDVPSIPISTSLAGPLAGSTGSKALPRVSLRNVESSIRTAYAHFWSASVEHEVVRNVVVGVDYTGSKGTNLYSLENPNRPGAGNVYLGDPCTIGDPFSCTARLRTTQYTNINRRGDKAFSNYNAMNVRVNVRNVANSGLNLTANYTWAHTIDNLSSTFSESSNNFNLGLLDPFNPRLDRGNADFDIRNRLVISAIWDVPFAKHTTGLVNRILNGWTFAPIFTASTGTPFSVFDCTNAFFSVCPRMFAAGSVPREGTGTLKQDPSTPATFTYLNLAGKFDTSFVNPITGSSEFGPYPKSMTSRNFFRGPGSWNLNLGLYKTTKVNERFNLQYRAEFYNAFNHANNSVLGSEADVSSQDVIRVQRQGRRQIQMALKLIF